MPTIGKRAVVFMVTLQNQGRFLWNEVRDILNKNGGNSEKNLAKYFREKFSERYFYDWKNFAYTTDGINQPYAID